METVDYLNKFFECVNDEYKFKIVAEGGDIVVLPLEDEWISSNRKHLEEIALAGTRPSKPFSVLLLNKNVLQKIFINTQKLDMGYTKNITRVILHEVAHALGLSDVEYSQYSGHSLMCAYGVNDWGAKFHARDIRALCSLYKKDSFTKQDVYDLMKNEELCADPDRPLEDSARAIFNNDLSR